MPPKKKCRKENPTDPPIQPLLPSASVASTSSVPSASTASSPSPGISSTTNASTTSASNPTTQPSLPRVQSPPKKFVLSYMFRDFREIPLHHLRSSPESTHFGREWKIQLGRIDDYFHVYLSSFTPITEEWKVEVETKIRIFTVDEESDIEQYSRHYLDKQKRVSDLSGARDFRSNQQRDIAVEVIVTILKTENIEIKRFRRFDKEIKNGTNMVFVVENEKFHVSKEWICSQSPVLKAMLTGSFLEANQEEVSLYGVRVDEFQNLLDVLYHEPALNEGSIEGVLRLADMYQIKSIMWKCEQFLINDSKTSEKLKVKLAWMYNFERLKYHCLKSLESPIDVRLVMEKDPSKMEPSLLIELLNKMLTFRL